MVWTILLCALCFFVGFCLGVIALALCVVAKRSDEVMRNMRR